LSATRSAASSTLSLSVVIEESRCWPLPGAYSVFEREFERIRKHYGLVVAGYVLMPEHVHLLMGEPLVSSLSVALQVLKQRTSRKLKTMGSLRFWQRRYYDFNVHSELK
jgi:putative transposase